MSQSKRVDGIYYTEIYNDASGFGKTVSLSAPVYTVNK